MTHIFLDAFPDVLTSASVDLQNESSVAVASHINTFPQVCLNRPDGIYRRSHMMRVMLDALHRTLPGHRFICFKYRVMVTWIGGVISAFILA